MTFAHCGTMVAKPGRRDELVAILTRLNVDLADAGCQLYEVGVNDDDPDKVFVVELWQSQDAHRDSLALPSTQAAIAQARELLTGEFGGFEFDIVGSPLHA